MFEMALPWWAWSIIAGILALAEMHAPGSYLVWIALGAALTSAAHAALGVSLEGQLIVFAVASAVSCGAGYFVYHRAPRRRRGEPLLNERSAAMIGGRGIVCEAFLNGRGKVRVGDTVWLATGPDLAVDTPVVVSAVHGTRLIVEPAEPRGARSAE